MSCLVFANALESGDDLDLDQTAGRKGGNLEGAARGERSLELGGVDLVHGGKVGDVGQVDRGLDDIGKRGAGSGQQGLDVGEGLLGLSLDASGSLPVAGSMPSWPDRNTMLPVWIPGEYGPMAAGALSEETTLLLMLFSLQAKGNGSAAFIPGGTVRSECRA